jgi:CBS domain-containing protein
MITGKPHRATMTAARVGQVFAGALIAGAAWGFLDLPLVGPRWVRIAMAIVSSVGLWGGLIGLFLFRGASDAYKSAAMRQQLTGRTVVDVMGSVPPAISPRTTLTEAAAQLSQKPSILWPVGEPLQGVVRLQELDAVKVEDWPSTFITAVMLPVASRTAASTVDLETAVGTLAGAPERQLVITDSGKAIGLLTESLLVLPER